MTVVSEQLITINATADYESNRIGSDTYHVRSAIDSFSVSREQGRSVVVANDGKMVEILLREKTYEDGVVTYELVQVVGPAS